MNRLRNICSLFIILVTLTGCINLGLTTTIPSSDSTAPEITFNPTPGVREVGRDEFKMRVTSRAYSVSSLAKDGESGIKRLYTQYRLNVSCSAAYGQPPVRTAVFTLLPKVENYSPSESGRVPSLAAVTQIMCLTSAGTDNCLQSIEERVCGGNKLHSFTGTVTVQATNHLNLSTNKVFRISADAEGRLNEPCMANVRPELSCVGENVSCGANNICSVSCVEGSTRQEQFTPTGCQSGFVISKTITCRDGVEVEDRDDDYCPFVRGGELNCGQGTTGRICSGPNEPICQPNFSCRSNLTRCEQRTDCPAPPACWLPGDVGFNGCYQQ